MTSGWRLRVSHRTHVSYDGPVRASYNEARMTPASLSRQSALEAEVSAGAGAPVWTYSDYWGTIVSSFDIQAPHDELVVRAQATVETRPAPPPGRPLPWPELRQRAAGGRLLEYLLPTARTAVSAERSATPPGGAPRAPIPPRPPRRSPRGSATGSRTCRARPRCRRAPRKPGTWARASAKT